MASRSHERLLGGCARDNVEHASQSVLEADLCPASERRRDASLAEWRSAPSTVNQFVSTATRRPRSCRKRGSPLLRDVLLSPLPQDAGGNTPSRARLSVPSPRSKTHRLDAAKIDSTRWSSARRRRL